MTTQTPALIARDAMFDRVFAMPFFAGFTFAKTKALRIQVDNIPYCGVYLINRMWMPEGDANHGDIRFKDSARIGFSVVVVDNDAEDGEATLDQAFKTITEGLLTDTTLTGFDRNIMQGITRGEMLLVYGSVALDNETPLLEMQFDMSVDLGVAIFKPVITDDLARVHVTARPIQNPDAPPVEMQWEIATQTRRGNNGKDKGHTKSRRSAAASD